MNDTPERVLIFINSIAALHAKDPTISIYIDAELDTKDWICLDSETKDFPDRFADQISDEYYHGYSLAQYALVKSGGIFINAMMTGLITDFPLWAETIHENTDFNQAIMYIDIPYYVYKATMGDDALSKEAYERNSESIKNIVTSLNQHIPTNIKLH